MVSQQISTGTFCPTKWVVSATAGQGTHTTITAAMADASSGDTIFIRSKSTAYTESFTWKAGVDICADAANAMSGNVTIQGVITVNAVGTYSMSGVRLKSSSSGNTIDATTAASEVYLTNCYFDVSGSGGYAILSLAGGCQMRVSGCQGDSTGASSTTTLFNISRGQLFIQHCRIFNTGGGATCTQTNGGGSEKFWIMQSDLSDWTATLSSGSFNVKNAIFGKITCNTGGGASANILNSLVGELDLSNSASVTVLNSIIYSSGTYAVDGASGTYGTVSMAGVTFFSDTVVGVHTSITQTPLQTYGYVRYSNYDTPNSDYASLQVGDASPNGSITSKKGSLWLRSSSAGEVYHNTDDATTWATL